MATTAVTAKLVLFLLFCLSLTYYAKAKGTNTTANPSYKPKGVIDPLILEALLQPSSSKSKKNGKSTSRTLSSKVSQHSKPSRLLTPTPLQQSAQTRVNKAVKDPVFEVQNSLDAKKKAKNPILDQLIADLLAPTPPRKVSPETSNQIKESRKKFSWPAKNKGQSNVRYFSEGSPFVDYDNEDSGQKQFDDDEDDQKGDDKPIDGRNLKDEPVKEVITDEDIKKELEKSRRIKDKIDYFWHLQKFYFKNVQTCNARDECLFNGRLSVKNSETLGTIFENAQNLQNALKIHMENSLKTRYPTFQRVRNIYVDYKFKAEDTIFDFQFQFYTGRQNGIVITNSMVQKFLWKGLTGRFFETYDIKPEYLKLGVKYPELKQNRKKANNTTSRTVYTCLNGRLIVNASTFEAIKNHPKKNEESPYITISCHKDIPVQYGSSLGALGTVAIVVAVMVIICCILFPFLWHCCNRKSLEELKKREWIQVEIAYAILQRLNFLHANSEEDPDNHPENEQRQQRLKRLERLQRQQSLGRQHRPQRLAIGLDLTSGLVRRNTQVNQSFFQRVRQRQRQLEEENTLEELEMVEEKLRKRRKFLSLVPKFRKEFIREGIIPATTQSLVRRHSFAEGKYRRKKKFDWFYASVRKPKVLPRPLELEMHSQANVHEVSSQVINEQQIGPPNATSTLLKQVKATTTTTTAVVHETADQTRRRRNDKIQRDRRKKDDEKNEERNETSDGATCLNYVQEAPEPSAQAQAQNPEKQKKNETKETTSDGATCLNYVQDVQEPPAQAQNPENQYSKHSPRKVCIPPAKIHGNDSLVEVVKNNVDLIESHLRITPQQLSSATESVQNRLVVKEHNDYNAEDASEHESAQSADASNESGSDGKGELGTQPPTPPPQPAKKTKDNSEHKDAQSANDGSSESEGAEIDKTTSSGSDGKNRIDPKDLVQGKRNLKPVKVSEQKPGCSSESPNDTLKIKLTKRRQSIAGKSTEETALENLSSRIPVQVQDPDTENDSDNDFDEPTDDDILDNDQQVLQEPDTADADDKVDNDDDSDDEKSKVD